MKKGVFGVYHEPSLSLLESFDPLAPIRINILQTVRREEINIYERQELTMNAFLLIGFDVTLGTLAFLITREFMERRSKKGDESQRENERD